jgi:ParB family chromosome partitioning protein
MGHARALLALGAVPQVQLAERIAANALSVRAAEQLVRRAANGVDDAQHGPVEARRRQPGDRDLARLEEELSDLLATPVALQPRPNGSGQVVIRYATLDQLDGILRRLRGG